MKIYQYTSINTLAKILENKTLLLNSVQNVDDKEEGVVSDYGSFASRVFVSCWALDSNENLTLWNMITKGIQDIRIGFEIEKIPFIGNKEDSTTNISIQNIKESKGYTYILWKDSSHIVKNTPLIAIDYIKNDEEKTFVKRCENDWPILDLNALVATKNEIWKPQNEVRFVILRGKGPYSVNILQELDKLAQKK